MTFFHKKTQSEFAAWKVLKELTERFQSLGYLPSQATQVIGTFYHHSDDSENHSPDSMRKTLLNIEQTAKDAGLLDSKVTAKIDALKARISQSEIAAEIKLLKGKTLKEKDKDDEEKHR